MQLSKAQKKYLRKVSHQERPLFQIGKQGLTEAFRQQLESAIDKRELIKITLLQNSDEEVNEVAQVIADDLDCLIVQTIGSTAVFYRPSSKEKNRVLSRELAKIKG
ncbi:YhbY family RNA-binding protein [Hutsoniella sourekii]